MTTNTGRLVRLSAVLASLALLLGVAATAFAAQGDEHLPCPNGGHFILQDNTEENIAILVGRGLVEGETTGGVTHLFYNAPIDQAVFDMIMDGFIKEGAGQPPLVLSHCLEGEGSETPHETPSETPAETPAETPSETPAETPAETPSETPEGSVVAGTSTPSETPEGSVQGGTGTPAPSQPDTAMGAGGGPSPIPTIAFGLILLAALGTLAWANVKSARSRA